jgi:acetyl esterase/lipase
MSLDQHNMKNLRIIGFLVALMSVFVVTPARSADAPASEIEQLSGVAFGKGGDRELRMNILRPKQKAAMPMPVVVYIFGGGWRSGNRSQGIGPLTPLAEKGYFCASIEYRLSTEAVFPAQIEDCKCAIRFLRAKAKEYNLDPDRIAVWGSSAGGHLAALLGTSGGVKELEGTGGWPEFSSRVQAVVDWFGPTDFLRMDAAGSSMKHDSATSPESLLIGGPIQENKEKAAKASPLTYVSKEGPAFLIMHGDQDPLVPINQSELLVNALRKAGIKVRYEIFPGAQHGFVGDLADNMVLQYLDETLKGLKPEKPLRVPSAAIPTELPPEQK